VIGAGIIHSIIDLVGSANPSITDQGQLYNTAAGIILALGAMGLFMIGRFIGSILMTWFKPNKLLFIYALCCIILTAIVVAGAGFVAIAALCLIYFFMSIMFPTIFALGLKDLGNHTKRASSFLVMAIVGGAIFPALMGYVADISSMKIGFMVPLACFVVVFFFGLYGYKPKKIA
jgi:FHS family L-fucose permease-like MFS transporter